MAEDKYALYIKKYNEIESLVKKIKDFPLDANMKYLEDTLEDSNLKNKLYLCRITRNYIQHNTDYKTFIDISEKQLEFLDDIKELVIGKIEKVEDISLPIKKAFTIKKTEKIQDNFPLILKKKSPLIPIINEDETLFGILNVSDIALLIINGLKKTDKFETIDKKNYFQNKDTFKFIKKGLLYEEALKLFKEDEKLRIIFVTENGKQNTKIIGIINR